MEFHFLQKYIRVESPNLPPSPPRPPSLANEGTQRRWYLNHETHTKTNSDERLYQNHLIMSFEDFEYAIG